MSALATDAVVWGLPLVLFGRYLDAAVEGGVPFNRFFMNSGIATPHSRAVGPNIDTLNGRAWIDVGKEPQVIGVPDTGDRYYSIQLQDMYMHSFAYLGRRTTGTASGAFAITGPGYEGTLPSGVTEVRAPTDKVFAFVRTLARGRDDLEAVRDLNGRFTLGPLSDGQVAATVSDEILDVFQPASRRAGGYLPHQDIAGAGAGYFEELDRLVGRFPPLPWDEPNLARFAPLGIGAPGPVGGDLQPAELAAAVTAGVDVASRSLRFESHNGWLRRPNVEPFLRNPAQRAANNLYGPGTHVAVESIFYNLRLGPNGQPLDGRNRYRLHFAPGELPPVDAFWSLTLYDDQYFLFDNSIDRYGITDRTEGLRYGVDGSLELLVKAGEPDDGASNWLPAPEHGFQLVLRTYQPRAELLDGTYRPPQLEIVGPVKS